MPINLAFGQGFPESSDLYSCYHENFEGGNSFEIYHNAYTYGIYGQTNIKSPTKFYPFTYKGTQYCFLKKFNISGLDGEDITEYEDVVKVLEIGYFNLYLHCTHLSRDHGVLRLLAGVQNNGKAMNFLVSVKGYPEIYLIDGRDKQAFKESVNYLFLRFGPIKLIDQVLDDQFTWETTPKLIRKANGIKNNN